MTIREATSADAARLLELSLHFLRATPYAAIMPERPDAIRALVDVVLERGTVFVATLDPSPAIVGMLAIVELPHPMTGDLYAEEIVWWVEPYARRGTAGPRLLAHAEAWATAKGLPFLKMVAPVGTDVGDYYTRLGYEAIETVYLKRLAA